MKVPRGTPPPLPPFRNSSPDFKKKRLPDRSSSESITCMNVAPSAGLNATQPKRESSGCRAEKPVMWKPLPSRVTTSPLEPVSLGGEPVAQVPQSFNRDGSAQYLSRVVAGIACGWHSVVFVEGSVAACAVPCHVLFEIACILQMKRNCAEDSKALMQTV